MSDLNKQAWPDQDVLEDQLKAGGFRLEHLQEFTPWPDHPNQISVSGRLSDGAIHPLLLKRYTGSPAYWEKERFAYRVASSVDSDRLTPELRASWRDSATDCAYLVMDDLTRSHRCPGSPDPQITEDELLSVITMYAAFHALHWGVMEEEWRAFFERTADLSVSHEAVSGEQITRCEDYFLTVSLPAKTKEYQDQLTEAEQDLIPQAIRHWACMFRARAADSGSLTLIQGDAHLGNVLLPRDKNQGMPLLIDWEGITPGMGTWDVVRLLHHTNWDSAKIARLEPIVRDRYFEQLAIGGVENYPRSLFEQDYRLSILAYLPHSLAWGNLKSLRFAIEAISRTGALDRQRPA